jgi:hypothetical protein
MKPWQMWLSGALVSGFVCSVAVGVIMNNRITAVESAGDVARRELAAERASSARLRESSIKLMEQAKSLFERAKKEDRFSGEATKLVAEAERVIKGLLPSTERYLWDSDFYYVVHEEASGPLAETMSVEGVCYDNPTRPVAYFWSVVFKLQDGQHVPESAIFDGAYYERNKGGNLVFNSAMESKPYRRHRYDKSNAIRSMSGRY